MAESETPEVVPGRHIRCHTLDPDPTFPTSMSTDPGRCDRCPSTAMDGHEGAAVESNEPGGFVLDLK